jgi:predicted 2-oxoglutarate/Fe(II)-dependent dioxygenase YbiX
VDSVTDTGIRKTNIVWLPVNESTQWVFRRMNQITNKINYDKFQLDLTNFDGFQYSKYDNGGHYSWHTDTMLSPPNGLFRKLSLVLMLTDPDEYTGGDLLLAPNGDNTKASAIRMKKGEIVAFYSHTAHKVQPVETGTRVTLVTWVTGPKLK